jgi:3-deoxy-D-manno-octulosonate cytidylyltransferase
MGNASDTLGVIPARWGSRRFPGKVLANLRGKPVIQWVWEKAVQVKGISKWLVATDDNRIFDAVGGFGGSAVMTSPDHPSGTDRIVEVMEGRTESIIVNVQGDEPLLNPDGVESMLAALKASPERMVGTAAYPIRALEELDNPNVVKVLLDRKSRAIAFSRSPIPYIRNRQSRQSWLELGVHYRHLGMYAYRREALEQFSQWEPGPLERAEQLEQFRFLEHGVPMICALVDHGSPDVNTPEDLKKIEQLLS